MYIYIYIYIHIYEYIFSYEICISVWSRNMDFDKIPHKVMRQLLQKTVKHKQLVPAKAGCNLKSLNVFRMKSPVTATLVLKKTIVKLCHIL